MDAIAIETRNGLTIKIYQDEDCQNPRRDYDPFGHMICFHRRYDLGDKHSMSMDELKEIVERKDVVALPLFLYDHSGITMSTGSFRDPWDSGQVGYIYITFKEILENWSGKRMTPSLRQKAIDSLQAHVKEYDDYLTGNVYGYVIEDKDGNELDSCWGYIGDYDGKDYGALAEARSQVNAMTNNGTTDHNGQVLMPLKEEVK